MSKCNAVVDIGIATHGVNLRRASPLATIVQLWWRVARANLGRICIDAAIIASGAREVHRHS